MGSSQKWLFVGSPSDGTYTWRSAHDGGTSDPFSGLPTAVADAIDNGLNLTSDYWIVQMNGRTTHYRPGKMPINLPTGEEPTD